MKAIKEISFILYKIKRNPINAVVPQVCFTTTTQELPPINYIASVKFSYCLVVGFIASWSLGFSLVTPSLTSQLCPH